ncbi:hypothetical protein QBE52_18665 [Clostridiaceae bacterium 35-E11]
MKDFKILKFLDRFATFFQRLGIDYIVMRKILQIKLTMDRRKVSTIVSNSSKNKEETASKDENYFKKSLLFYGLVGIVMVPLIIMGENFIFQMSFVFGIFMFMMMTTLITDFSSVLLDIRDKNIISSKPVDSKTLSTAKILHISMYILSITTALAGAALIAALIKHGILFCIIFALEILLMDVLIVVLTALLYLLILKFFDGEKLKDIINYVQIALSIAITVGYQLIARLFNFMDFNMVFTLKWWQYFIIPTWFGAPFEWILHGDDRIEFVVFTLLAVLVPMISLVVYIKLIPVFEKNLQKLNNYAAKTEKIKAFDKLSKIICRNKQERTFLKFASYMMKNERAFKLKVYPSLGFALIFPFIFIFNELQRSTFHAIASSKLYFNIYFCALLLPTAVMMMKYSETYKGAWIYKSAPIKDTAPIFKGTLKAFIVRLLFPIYLIEGIIFMGIFSIRILPDLIIVFLNILLFAVICFKSLRKSLPFSEPYNATQQSGGLTVLPLMFFLGALAGVHYLCTLFRYGIYIWIAILILCNGVVWKKFMNISLETLVGTQE